MDTNTQHTDQQASQQIEDLFQNASQQIDYLDPVSFNIGARMALDQANQVIANLQDQLKTAQRALEDA